MIVIEGPTFYCGVEVENGRVTRAAPIVGWTKGKTLKEVMQYCHRRGWRIRMVGRDGLGADQCEPDKLC